MPARRPLKALLAPRRSLPPSVVVVTTIGPIEIAVRHSPRARRVSLKFDPAEDGFELVVPPRASLKQALGFAQQHAGWLAGHLKDLPPRVPFAPGSVIPILGHSYWIRHYGDRGPPVFLKDGELMVSGAAEHLARRIRDFLHHRARAEIVPRAHAYAAKLGRKVRRVSLRDPKTRWGSCAASGDLAFSWRLVLAPEHVMAYVIAHEVAHLSEMNHSKRFWAMVDRLMPDAERSKAWLKRHGKSLLRYG
ncbi:MAG: M48 family metallopeptidase [Alphaproteobacteria bacterium]|nr:M48 family metallopeptidase [Alphaproteobacteria bacterium]